MKHSLTHTAIAIASMRRRLRKTTSTVGTDVGGQPAAEAARMNGWRMLLALHSLHCACRAVEVRKTPCTGACPHLWCPAHSTSPAEQGIYEVLVYGESVSRHDEDTDAIAAAQRFNHRLAPDWIECTGF